MKLINSNSLECRKHTIELDNGCFVILVTLIDEGEMTHYLLDLYETKMESPELCDQVVAFVNSKKK